MKTRLCFFLCLVGVVLSQVSIEPQSAVVRRGELFQAVCRVNEPVRQCLWEVNGALYSPAENIKYRPLGNSADGECGIQTDIVDADNGVWKCRIFTETAKSALNAATNVTVVALPRLELRPFENPIIATTNRETEVTCVIQGTRPTPTVTWFVGEREIDPVYHVSNVSISLDGLSVITDTLRYVFQVEDHNQVLRCAAVGQWFTPEDEREVSATLNVQFPPQPRDAITQYGFVTGQPGELAVNFTANPRPYRVDWRLEDGTEIPVDLNNFQQSNENTQFIEGGDGSYEARLRLPSVTEEDAFRTYHLVVRAELDGQDYVQEYAVQVSLTSAPAAEEHGIGGGGIAAIIVILLLVLFVVAVVLFAHFTGRWCFAGTKAVGVSTKPSDEESAKVSEAPAEKAEVNRRSLSNRLSSLYETIISKTAPKKTDRNTGVSNCAADPEIAKDGTVVYAELDIRTSGQTDEVRGQGEATEYAEIVGLSADKKSQTADKV